MAWVKDYVYGSSSTTGSVVEVEQILTSGTEIATITVDGEDTTIYAPSGTGNIYVEDETMVVE